MKLPRTVLPDTVFGRLLAATLAVLGVLLLIFVLLIMRERRELAMLDTGTSSSAANVAETSEYLASLPVEQRRTAWEELREQRMLPEEVRDRLRSRRHQQMMDRAVLERTYISRLQRQLGSDYTITIGPPRTPRRDVIPLYLDQYTQSVREGTAGPRFDRLIDVTVTLPDGDTAVFRAIAPQPGPGLPKRIFVDLGILALLLAAVLYAVTRTITRPLGDLARAADTIGRSTNAMPIEERGARELRQATRAFNAMQERLQRYLDSRTRVLAAMSHDLRTPLTRLRLRVESIDDEALRQRCTEDLDEMSNMVRGALGVFRGLNDEESPQAVDINALAQELQRQYEELGETVQISGRAHSPYHARPLALKRCLGNLIQNALHHGENATLQIDDGKQLVLRVLDTGPGIPEDALERVFEPFLRLEASRNRDTGGTGLGLSIARDIAQSHGGSLTLHNRTGGGLEARLSLPREDVNA